MSSGLAQQRAPRILEYAPNASIADRLRPDDEVVVVRRSANYPVFDPEPKPEQVLLGLLESQHGTAVLVDVTSVKGTLVDEGRWIQTVFEGSVVETVNTAIADGKRVPSLPRGTSLTTSLDGGSVTIGKVLAKTENSVAFPTGERYLMFVAPYRDPGTGFRRLDTDPLIVRNNRLVAVPGSQSKLAGLTLDDVRRVARALK